MLENFDLRYVAIGLAVMGAVALALGAQFQNDAVGSRPGGKTARPGALTLKQLFGLLREPKWISGLGLIVVALVLQLSALTLAPLIVVQPIGAIALVITSVINARVTKTKLNRATISALGLCVLGVGLFVGQASTVAKETRIDDAKLWIVLGLLTVILATLGTLFFTISKRMKALSFIVGAGLLYGFVATMTKVIIQRAYQLQFEWLTVLCLVGLVAAVTLGGWFVQNAYASGPPDLVIAGLTVIDPLVAVLVGITVLGEAQTANLVNIIGFLISGMIAITGVYLLSKVHPEIVAAEKRLARLAKRGL